MDRFAVSRRGSASAPVGEVGLARRAALRPRLPKCATAARRFIAVSDQCPAAITAVRHRPVYLRPITPRGLPRKVRPSDLLRVISALAASPADRLCPAAFDRPAIVLRMQQTAIGLPRLIGARRPDRQNIRPVCLMRTTVWDRLASELAPDRGRRPAAAALSVCIATRCVSAVIRT